MDLEGALASFVEALERRRGLEYVVIDTEGTVIERRRYAAGYSDLRRLEVVIVAPPGQ